GAASLPLAPPATLVIGTDESDEMVAAFVARAKERGVPYRAYPGRWPDVARAVPEADVVVSNHVLYNVPDLAAFALALTAHPRPPARGGGGPRRLPRTGRAGGGHHLVGGRGRGRGRLTTAG